MKYMQINKITRFAYFATYFFTSKGVCFYVECANKNNFITEAKFDKGYKGEYLYMLKSQ